MTRLASLLDHPERLLDALRVRAPELVLLPRAVAQISGEARAINLEATEALQQRVAGLISEGQVASLSRRDLRESCRTFLHPPHPPAKDTTIANPICDQVETLRRRSALFALLDAYLDGFDQDDADVAWLAKRLTTASKSWPWRGTDPWPARIKAFELLTPSKAPGRLAAAVLGGKGDFRSILDEAGLTTEGRRIGGLGLAGFTAACETVRKLKAAQAVAAQERLIEWSGGSGTLAYPKAWPQFAGALFEPWGASEPARAHKTLIVDKAVAHAGDPRINRARWRPVEEVAGDAYAIILRWLTEASVRQFFDIVNETMTDRPDMWADRRKFWTRYLDADMISAAWVAFGSDGAARADRAAQRTGDKSLSMFGRLASGSGRSSQHAALIMKIGDLTIAEWSHNGKWNIWGRNDPKHPVLFRHNSRRLPDYDSSELMRAPTSGSHTTWWQSRVADIIKNETGLRP
ncbi:MULTISPECIES: EH signature domain-containing protein [unclassified Brevundimonas]|uniref:EH signature domain-containing protein n=1 Tax=unclassified Brevundimonas TaxID=2622653 RepID=UPI0006FED98F|nr:MULTISPECIES: EH signature domain-containing protein [unclassified Brevundimonas]KRA28532.1 hypothetical protein ASD59_01490 [Brevundimonas sp. Root608]